MSSVESIQIMRPPHHYESVPAYPSIADLLMPSVCYVAFSCAPKKEIPEHRKKARKVRRSIFNEQRGQHLPAIRQGIDDGKTVRQIADALCISPVSVYRYISADGIRTKNKAAREIFNENEYAIRKSANAIGVAKTAREYGLWRRSLDRFLEG